MTFKKTFIIITILNVTLALGQFAISAWRATDGAKLNDLVQELDQVTQDNYQLRAQIYDHSSLSQIQRQADALGLTRVLANFVTMSDAVASAQ